MLNLSIIVLNWNGWAYTKACLESLYCSTFKNFAVLLIDNGSDNDCTYIRDWAKSNIKCFQEYTKIEALNNKVSFNSTDPLASKLILIKNEENLGFAKANNVGIKVSLNNGIEYVFLLNNDTQVTSSAIEVLFNAIVHHNIYAAVAPQIRYLNPSDTIWCCGGEIKNFYEYYYYKHKSIYEITEPLEGIKEVSFLTGCALLLRIKDVGLLTERFFFGEEDVELSLRLKKAGKKIACILDSVIYHNESVSINSSSNYINRIYVHKLNRFIGIKHYTPLTAHLRIIYRSFKFFALLLFIEKLGFIRSVQFTRRILLQSFTLKKVDKETFFSTLSLNFRK